MWPQVLFALHRLSLCHAILHSVCYWLCCGQWPICLLVWSCKKCIRNGKFLCKNLYFCLLWKNHVSNILFRFFAKTEHYISTDTVVPACNENNLVRRSPAICWFSLALLQHFTNKPAMVSVKKHEHCFPSLKARYQKHKAIGTPIRWSCWFRAGRPRCTPEKQ